MGVQRDNEDRRLPPVNSRSQRVWYRTSHKAWSNASSARQHSNSAGGVGRDGRVDGNHKDEGLVLRYSSNRSAARDLRRTAHEEVRSSHLILQGRYRHRSYKTSTHHPPLLNCFENLRPLLPLKFARQGFPLSNVSTILAEHWQAMTNRSLHVHHLSPNRLLIFILIISGIHPCLSKGGPSTHRNIHLLLHLAQQKIRPGLLHLN